MSSSQLPSFTLQALPKSLPALKMDKLLLSPSGRYALQLQEDEIKQDPRQEKKTHYFRQKFILLDLYNRQWSIYTSLVGPLSRSRLYYWLSDDALVLVTFSRYHGTLEQNLVMVDHGRRLVENRVTRRYEWSVDNVLAAYVTNVTPLLLYGQEYLPVFGERDDTAGLLMMAIPYRLTPSLDPLRQLEIPELAIIRYFVPTSQPTGYPFTLGSKILFRYTSHLTDLQSVNSFIALDVEKFFEENKGSFVAPHLSSLQILTVPHHDGGGGLPMGISDYNVMDNTPTRHVYYVRFTTSCFLVDFEKNRCEWIHPVNADQQYCGNILMHPSELVLNVANGERRGNRTNEIIVRSFGRSQLRVSTLEKMALATVLENSTTLIHTGNNHYNHSLLLE